MSPKDSAIQIDVDVANPGQFLACCGLLELADRCWNGAEGWFTAKGDEFFLRPIEDTQIANAESFLNVIKKSRLESTMEPKDKQRLDELENKKSQERTQAMKEEKTRLKKLQKTFPLILESPFFLWIDWYLDKRSGGRRFKTWAGQQSVYDIGINMKRPLDEGKYDAVPASDWLYHTCGQGVPFFFDTSIGAHSAVLDVGFSTDTLNMSGEKRPLLELAAFVGLQRFRPMRPPKINSHLYRTWTVPACPQTASIAASGVLISPESQSFAFPLLFRTDYLKSFLPAQLLMR